MENFILCRMSAELIDNNHIIYFYINWREVYRIKNRFKFNTDIDRKSLGQHM